MNTIRFDEDDKPKKSANEDIVHVNILIEDDEDKSTEEEPASSKIQENSEHLRKLVADKIFQYCTKNKTYPNDISLSIHKKAFEANIQIELPLEIDGYVTAKYVTPSGQNTFIVEDPKWRFDRYYYLKNIIAMRNEGRDIFYVGAKWSEDNIDLNYSDFISLKDNTRVFFLYIASKDGYLTGTHYTKLSEEIAENWVCNILPFFAQPSAVVFNDVPIFKNDVNKLPSEFDSRATMLHWLTINNIPCDNITRKAQLYSLIQKYGNKNPQYKIKTLLEAYGHKALYIPSYLTEVNLLNKVWKEVKHKEDKKRKSPKNRELGATENPNLEHILAKIKQTKWNSQNDNIIELEKTINANDMLVDKVFESTVKHLIK